MPTHDINITASFVQDGDTLATGLTFPANGLKIKESGGGSDVLTLRLDEVLSNNRALNIQVSDGDRTVNVTGDAELEGTNTGDETTSTLGSKINGATEKTTPVDADMVGLMDSAASNILKKLSWANVKATLFTAVGSALRQLATPAAARWIRVNSDGTATLRSDTETRTDIGLGTIATQDASSVAITGGSVTGITDLAVADGGTGASTGSAALTNLGIIRAGTTNSYATSSTSFSNVTGCQVTLAANTLYECRIHYKFQSANASSGVNVAISATNSPDIGLLLAQATSASTIGANRVITANDNIGAAITSITDVATDLMGVIRGEVQTGGSGSVLDLRLARGGASASNVTILKATMVFTPIG